MSKRGILIGKIKGKNRMFIHYSHTKFAATDEFVEALKNLLRAEIIMMRKNRPDYADSWICGVAIVGDLSLSTGIQFMFGSKEDAAWLRKESPIFVEVE